MKKIFCALLISSMIISLAGCNNKEEEKISSSAAESSVIDDSVSEEAEKLESDTEEAKKSGSEANEGLHGDVYEGKTYSFTINDKWELNESAGDALDCTFNYVAYSDDLNEAATCFGIQTLSAPGVSLEEMAEQMVDTYGNLSGYTVTGTKAVKFNYMDAQEIMLEIDSAGVKLIMRQILFSDGENINAINATAVVSCYDKMIAEIDDVLSTFKFN
ncbi:MAG: hypothetical protein ACI4I9_07860 [Porcipelethomonas sp.]